MHARECCVHRNAWNVCNSHTRHRFFFFFFSYLLNVRLSRWHICCRWDERPVSGWDFLRHPPDCWTLYSRSWYRLLLLRILMTVVLLSFADSRFAVSARPVYAIGVPPKTHTHTSTISSCHTQKTSLQLFGFCVACCWSDRCFPFSWSCFENVYNDVQLFSAASFRQRSARHAMYDDNINVVCCVKSASLWRRQRVNIITYIIVHMHT